MSRHVANLTNFSILRVLLSILSLAVRGFVTFIRTYYTPYSSFVYRTVFHWVPEVVAPLTQCWRAIFNVCRTATAFVWFRNSWCLIARKRIVSFSLHFQHNSYSAIVLQLQILHNLQINLNFRLPESLYIGSTSDMNLVYSWYVIQDSYLATFKGPFKCSNPGSLKVNTCSVVLQWYVS